MHSDLMPLGLGSCYVYWKNAFWLTNTPSIVRSGVTRFNIQKNAGQHLRAREEDLPWGESSRFEVQSMMVHYHDLLIITLPADAWFAARLLPKFFRFDSLAILEPNWIALLGRTAASCKPSICATSLRIFLSPVPLG